MESILTVKTKIRKDDRLVKTLSIYARAIQFAIDTAWRLGLKTRRGFMMSAIARLGKDSSSNLNSQSASSVKRAR